MSNLPYVFSKVARLVDKANCQYTFGVFTKWDQLVKRTKEEGEDPVDDEISKSYKQEFQNVVKGQCEVFFVDVKSEHTDDVSLLFLLFYSMLHAVC